MKKTNINVVWGVLLIVAGVLFLIQTYTRGVTTDQAWAGLWAIMFAAAGLSFLWRFLTDRVASWWAIIPGMALLALSALTGISGLGFDLEEGTWLGALFLGSIGLGFWVAYFARPEFWWSIIPGGVFFSLAAVVLASMWFKDEVPGAVLFFGLALTFLLVYVVPVPGGPLTPRGHMTWALVPATIMAAMGFVVLLALTTAMNYVWPVILIVVGLYLLYRQTGHGMSASGGTRRG
jgi:hypothetical protein